MTEKILVIKVSEEQFEKLNIMSTHIQSSPDHVASQILRATLDSSSWQLEHLKEILLNEVTT